jgi:hypothetical protein
MGRWLRFRQRRRPCRNSLVAWLRELLVAPPRGRAAPRGDRGLGHLGGDDETPLVRRYGTLDGVLEAGLFPTQAEMLRLYRLIVTMDASAPLPSLADQEPTWASASSLARDWGLNQLADRLDEKA